MQCIENLLKSGTTASNIVRHEMPFSSRKFVFDEVPNELWERLDAYCREGGGKRIIKIYEAVEAALITELTKVNQNGK